MKGVGEGHGQGRLKLQGGQLAIKRNEISDKRQNGMVETEKHDTIARM